MCSLSFIFLLTPLFNAKCKAMIEPIETFQPLNKPERFRETTYTPESSLTIWERVFMFTEEAKSSVTEESDYEKRFWEPVESVTPAYSYTHYSILNDDTTPSTISIMKMCPNFTETMSPFQIEKMADIWKTVYYQLEPWQENKLQCFIIHIKRVTDEDRYTLNLKYGNFEGKVNWSNVFLEVLAESKNKMKHFLQGGYENDGVMKNIIITEDKQAHQPVFHDESADQWLVYQQLLLMRDCDSGDIVVFSKFPYAPLQNEIRHAFDIFGAHYGGGTEACMEDDDDHKHFEPEDYGGNNY